LIAQLHQALEEYEDDIKAVSVWAALVTKHPQVTSLQKQLRQLLHELCDDDYAIEVWKELVEKFPENTGLREEFNAAVEFKNTVYDGELGSPSFDWVDSLFKPPST